MDPGYGEKRTRCNANFNQDCVDYFLALPRSDLLTSNVSRGNFAGSYCSDMRRMGEVPCSILCRDNVAQCLSDRRAYCAGVTLEQVEDGTRPECACYLPRSEYERHIRILQSRLGDEAARQLEVAINSPYCFYGPCARSRIGLDTRTGGCQALTGCVQSIEFTPESGSRVIATNICTIENATVPVSPPPPSIPVASFDWTWVILIAIVSLIAFIVIILVIVYIYRRQKKQREMNELKRALLLTT